MRPSRKAGKGGGSGSPSSRGQTGASLDRRVLPRVRCQVYLLGQACLTGSHPRSDAPSHLIAVGGPHAGWGCMAGILLWLSYRPPRRRLRREC